MLIHLHTVLHLLKLYLLLLDELYKYCILTCIFKVFVRDVCTTILNMFTRLCELHVEDIRGSNYDFFVLRCNVTSRKNFITYQGPHLWKDLSLRTELFNSVLCQGPWIVLNI
jgi:hypothetical protein